MELEEQNGITMFLSLDSLLEILGNPTRRIVLSKLAKVPHTTSELARSLGISRQAIHQQLKILMENNIIEEINPDERINAYRIRSNFTLRIDLSPDYYNIEYKATEIDNSVKSIQLKDIGCQIDFEKIILPNEKLRFIGEKIKVIEGQINLLEKERSTLLQNKECLIVELKKVIAQQYEHKLRREYPNLEKEIFFTLFYNPMKYFKRINIDNLLDDLFFSNLDLIKREQHRVSIRHLLRDLSNMMDFLVEDDENFWFFDI